MSCSAPKLDNGFFQNFIDGRVPANTHPVLQVVESRQMASSSIYRLRMSDGNFLYSSCTIEVEITDRFEKDGLQRGHGIIRVLKFSSDDKAGKKWLKIHDYSLIMADYPSMIGNPQTYTGKVEERQTENINGHGEKRGAPPKNESPTYEPSPKRPSHQMQLSVGNHTPGQPLTPIDLLTPYVNKWRVCGVVSNKSDIREFNTAKGEFKVFSFILTDSKGSSIRCSAFNEAATAFADVITDGSTYYISGAGGIRASNKQYDPTPHSYEISLQKNSIIDPCRDVYVPTQPPKLHVIPLAKIPDHVGKIIDIIAIIRHADDVTTVITKRDQKELSKRSIYLVDKSGAEVAYTLWGDAANNFDKSRVGQVVAVKGASVREFNGGYSLSTSQYAGCSMLYENLPADAVRPLVAWYEQKKDSPSDFKSLAGGDGGGSASDTRLMGVAVQQQFSLNSERPVYMNITGMILSVKTENAIYQACGGEGCKKKVDQDGGYYKCAKCGWSGGECKYLFNLQIEVADFSGTVWISVFDEHARTLVNMDAKDVWQTKENSSIDEYNAIFGGLRFHSYEFRCSLRYETYNDQQRQKWGVFSIRPVPVERMIAVYKKIIAMEDTL